MIIVYGFVFYLHINMANDLPTLLLISISNYIAQDQFYVCCIKLGTLYSRIFSINTHTHTHTHSNTCLLLISMILNYQTENKFYPNKERKKNLIS